METFSDLKKWLEKSRMVNEIMESLDDMMIQIYQNSTLQANASFKNHEAFIKFEERSPNVFTVAVTPIEGGSIQYTEAKTFQLCDPISLLSVKFPDRVDIDHLVELLQAKQISKKN